MKQLFKFTILALLGTLTFSAQALFSEHDRSEIEGAIRGRRITDLQERFSKIDGSPNVEQVKTALSRYDLVGINTGLAALGLPVLEPAVETRTYTIQDKAGKSYLLRPLAAEDEDKMHALETAHIESGAPFVDGEIVPGEHRANGYFMHYQAHFMAQPFAKFWVLQDLGTDQIAGFFDYRKHAVTILSPTYQGLGLAQKAVPLLLPYLKEHLGMFQLTCPSEELATSLLEAMDFETYSAGVPHHLTLKFKPYKGFKADVHYKNIASLKVHCRMDGFSIIDCQDSHVRFVFPARGYPLVLRTLVQVMTMSQSPEEREIVFNAMQAQETPSDGAAVDSEPSTSQDHEQPMPQS